MNASRNSCGPREMALLSLLVLAAAGCATIERDEVAAPPDGGAVMIGSQPFNPLVVVCYVMCPLVGLVFLVGLPLRIAGRFAVPIATIYLAIGACLAGAGRMQLISLYGRPNLEFEPMLASLLTEAGLALLCGALLKLWRCGAFSAPAIAQADSNLAGAGS